ncbi:hypothetical protein AB0J90_16815 [Micromonospora sp. NPDC049523]|uniref:hypothetical protein n=1 Tax=Micromonospora sp. NPDC049523 TaxID=3155921 RepID=UPI00342E1A26
MAVTLVLAVLLIYDNFVYIRPLVRSYPRKIGQVSTRRARELQRLASANRIIGSGQASVFALAISTPFMLRERVVELYEPGQRTLHRRVTVEVQLPKPLVKTYLRDGEPPRVGVSDQPTGPSAEGRPGPLAPPLRGEENLSLHFPLIIARKGELHDNFVVSDVEGTYLPVLSYPECLQFVASVLRMLLLKAYNSGNSRAALSPEVLEAENRALTRIIRRNLPESPVSHRPPVSQHRDDDDEDDDEEESKRRIEEELLRLDGKSGPDLLGMLVQPISDEQKKAVTRLLNSFPPHELLRKLEAPNKKALLLAAELVRKLSDNYVIVVRLPRPSDGRFVVHYEATVIPRLRLSRRGKWSPVGWLGGRMRILLGARPVQLAVSLANAGTGRSYHLKVQSPEGLYLRSQEFVDAEEYLKVKADKAPTLPYYRFRQRLGQSYAHFYARFLAEVPNVPMRPPPRIRFTFIEVPPGSLFRATVASSACFLLVLVVGNLMSHGHDPGTDAPAFLLAFPAVAATWLGFEAPSRRLLEPTLTARLALVGTTLISVAASALYMAFKATNDVDNGSGAPRWNDSVLPGGVSVLGVTNLWWGILVLISCVMSAYVFRLYVLRVREFMRLSSRRHLDGGAEEA